MAARPFVDTLREINEGAFLNELDIEFHKLSQAVAQTVKGGKLVIEITMSPNKDEISVFIDGKVKASAPKPARASTIMFFTPDFNLDRRNPRQQELDLRVVENAKPQLKELG